MIDPLRYPEAGLSDAETSLILTFMRGRGFLMVDAGLNHGRMPGEEAERRVWEAKRDAFNAQTTAGLMETLPPGTARLLNLDDAFLEFLEMDFDKGKGLTTAP